MLGIPDVESFSKANVDIESFLQQDVGRKAK